MKDYFSPKLTTHFATSNVHFVMTPGDPPSLLPAGLDTSGFVDITTINDRFRRYLDTKTGKVHDGAEYQRQVLDFERKES